MLSHVWHLGKVVYGTFLEIEVCKLVGLNRLIKAGGCP